MTAYRFEIDFGFSGLAMWFHGPWDHEHTAAQTVANVTVGRIGDPPGAGATALVQDTLRLLNSR